MTTETVEELALAALRALGADTDCVKEVVVRIAPGVITVQVTHDVMPHTLVEEFSEGLSRKQRLYKLVEI